MGLFLTLLSFLEPEELMIYKHVCKEFRHYCTDALKSVCQYTYEFDICTWIARNGHTFLMIWARNNNYLYWEDFSDTRKALWPADNRHGYEQKTIEIAAERGHFLLFEWMFENTPPQPSDHAAIVAAAAKGGHMQLVDRLLNDGYEWDVRTIDRIAARGDIKFLEWANAKGAPWGPNVGRYSLESGSLPMVNYVFINKGHQAFMPVDFQIPSSKGNIPVLQFFLERSFQKTTHYAYGASFGNQLKTLKWLEINHYPLHDQIMEHAARNGNMEMLIWAHERLTSRNERPAIEAAKRDDFNMLKWLMRKNYLIDNDVIFHAVDNGNMDMIRYVHSSSDIRDYRLAARAAFHGDLHVLKWLEERNYTLNADVTYYAAEYDDMEMLRWALRKKCPLDGRPAISAARKGRLPMLKWLRLNECPWSDQVLLEAIENGHVHVSEWIRGGYRDLGSESPVLGSEFPIDASQSPGHACQSPGWASDEEQDCSRDGSITDCVVEESTVDFPPECSTVENSPAHNFIAESPVTDMGIDRDTLEVIHVHDSSSEESEEDQEDFDETETSRASKRTKI